MLLCGFARSLRTLSSTRFRNDGAGVHTRDAHVAYGHENRIRVLEEIDEKKARDNVRIHAGSRNLLRAPSNDTEPADSLTADSHKHAAPIPRSGIGAEKWNRKAQRSQEWQQKLGGVEPGLRLQLPVDLHTTKRHL
jgi:hypothetical protein